MTQPWIQTRPAIRRDTGGRVDLVTPRAEQIDFRVVAAVLARVPRFGAHTDHVLSVAQHCSEGAQAIIRDTGRRDWAAAFLVHDAHEYLIGDIATPVVDGLAAHAVLVAGDMGAGGLVKAAVRSLKTALDEAIHAAAGLAWPLSQDALAVVKGYDLRMGRTERDARLAVPPIAWGADWEEAERVEGVDLAAWSEETARARYWSSAVDLLPNVGTVITGDGSGVALPVFDRTGTRVCAALPSRGVSD